MSASKIADDLERLCCAETEGKFFDYVTESIGTIIAALRENERLRETLIALMNHARAFGVFRDDIGQAVENFCDGVIADHEDSALTPSQGREGK